MTRATILATIGYCLGAVALVAFLTIVTYKISFGNSYLAALMLIAVVLVLAFIFYRWLIFNWLVIGVLITAAIVGAMIQVLTPDWLGSTWSLKDAFMRDKAVENNVAESHLETFRLLAETPLYVYEKKGDAVSYKRHLKKDLVVRLKPKKADIQGVSYWEVIFPIKQNGAYLEGVWDSTSETFFVEVVSLTNERQLKKEVADLEKKILSLEEKERAKNLQDLQRAKDEAEKRVRETEQRNLELESKLISSLKSPSSTSQPRPTAIPPVQVSRNGHVVVLSEETGRTEFPENLLFPIPHGSKVVVLDDLRFETVGPSPAIGWFIGGKKLLLSKKNTLVIPAGTIFENRGIPKIDVIATGRIKMIGKARIQVLS